MTEAQMFLVILAVPATVYQVINLLVLHGGIMYHGTVRLKVSWWFVMLGTMFVQMLAVLQLLEAWR